MGKHKSMIRVQSVGDCLCVPQVHPGFLKKTSLWTPNSCNGSSTRSASSTLSLWPFLTDPNFRYSCCQKGPASLSQAPDMWCFSISRLPKEFELRFTGTKLQGSLQENKEIVLCFWIQETDWQLPVSEALTRTGAQALPTLPALQKLALYSGHGGC